ncbi:MAG TPA: FKBP-type peptidyl-prolyl cis-trans isomerase [Bacillota bacterium]|nr:FKBP-type peptidyl-prolyl cis-trans isomerase [Bacillota bacterium]
MAKTRPHERVIALVIAVLFFGFSFGLSFVVIYQLYSNNKEAKNVNNTSTSSNNNTPAASTNTQASGKLEGTQLADFTPVDHIDSLQTVDQQAGNGSEAKAGDTVTVHYTGAVAATGKIFQSSYDTGQPVSFSLSGVIKGWQDGIPGMKAGGKRRLLIPADQAYGANPPSGSGIPANADLVFDVTLVSVGE